MELADYTELIKHIPYKDQAFETKQATWKSFKKDKLFASYYEEVFRKGEVVTISRGELFSIVKKDSLKAIFSTILWGYPRGYTRANNMALSFPLFLKQTQHLCSRLSIGGNITVEGLEDMLKACRGVGLSTLSKLLYFFEMKLDGYQCLILDARIVQVLSKSTFTELESVSSIREHSKLKYYTKYLEISNRLSEKYGYKPDQLELFLFMFGNNLKQAL